MTSDLVRCPTFVVRLTPEFVCEDPIRLLRQLLKLALRRFGLRCTSILEEEDMMVRDAEFRQALAKAMKAGRDVAFTPSLKETKVHELDDHQWNWIAATMIFAWNNAQRDSLKNGYDQLNDILPKLGKLPLDWNKPLRDWSKDKIKSFINKAIVLLLKNNAPPFINQGRRRLMCRSTTRFLIEGFGYERCCFQDKNYIRGTGRSAYQADGIDER
jgi:hypothetical protein